MEGCASHQQLPAQLCYILVWLFNVDWFQDSWVVFTTSLLVSFGQVINTYYSILPIYYMTVIFYLPGLWGECRLNFEKFYKAGVLEVWSFNLKYSSVYFCDLYD